MAPYVRERWVLGAAVAVYLLLVGVSVTVMDGRVIYPLDDAYIHLAVARTIATSGVWGVQPGDWAAASSSPLFTMLLAGLYLVWPVGIDFSYAPLFVNMLAAIALICVSVAPVVILFLALPLVPLSLLGMEHTLHVLVAVMLAVAGIEALWERRPNYAALAALSAAAATCRYESMVVVVMLGLFAMLARRWKLALVVVVSAVLPLLALGLMWRAHGGWLEPNSVIVKAMLGYRSPLSKIAFDLTGPRRVPSFTLIAAMLLTSVFTVIRAKEKPLQPAVLLGALAVCAGAVQMLTGDVGWLFRYEAWLIFLNVAAITVLLSRPSAPPIMVVLCLVLAPRWYLDTRDTRLASQDKYNQHIVPALFAKRFFPGDTILVNDIGAMTWLSSSPVLDLVGLSSNEALRMRMNGSYTADAVNQWAHSRNTQIAVIQSCWPFTQPLTPRTWELVEVWHPPRDIMFHQNTVGFYAVAPGAADRLRQDLAAFAAPISMGRVHVPAHASAGDVARALDCH